MKTAELLTQLVQVESVNPTLVPGGRGEAAIAELVGTWLTELNLEVSTEEVQPGRPNVVARLPGRGGGRTLLFNAHLDTVGPGGMADPFVAAIHDGQLRGRGAADTKGGVAAALIAMRTLAASGRLSGDVLFAGVADEESDSIGSEALARVVQVDGAIVIEPTDLVVITSHKGFVWADISTEGVAAHGSLPDQGDDAIGKMGPVLVRLQAYADELLRRTGHPVLGPPSVHASLITGGQELSSYPEHCLLQLERRTVPGESADQIAAELTRIAQPEGRVQLGLVRAPLETDGSSELLTAVLSAVAAARPDGQAPRGGFSGWTDAAILSDAGIPSVVLGPSGGGFHADDEWVDLESVDVCADALVRIATEFCD